MLYLNEPINSSNLTEAIEADAKEYYEGIKNEWDKEQILEFTQNISGKFPELAVSILALSEGIPLNEFIVKHVSSKGVLTRTKDRKTRAIQAYQTTGLSKSKRREIARKVVKAKKANPSAQKRGERKKKRAMARRKAMGI